MRSPKIVLLFVSTIILNISSIFGQDNPPPLYISMSFTANCNFSEYSWEQTDGLVKDGYTKLLDIVEKHPKVKIHLSPTGLTADIYNLFFPVAKNRWQKAVDNGKVSISSNSYSHPLFTMNQKEDIVRNIIKGVNSVKTVWDTANEKFLILPQNAYDLTIHKKLNESGIVYSFVPREKIPAPEWDYTEEWQKHWFYKGVVTLDGADGGKLVCLLSGGAEKLGDIVSGNLKDAVDKIHKIQEINKKRGGGILIAFVENAEFLYSSEGLKSEAAEGFDGFLTELEKMPFVKFITPEEYLNIQEPEARYTIDYGIDYSSLISGESDYNINNAVVTNRKKLSEIKEKMDAIKRRDISEVKMLYEEAWIHAVLSQTSDALGRNTSKDKVEYGRLHAQITGKIIDDCTALLNETKEFKKTEIKDWRFEFGEIHKNKNPVWPATRTDMWEKVLIPHATKIKEIRTRDWAKMKNIDDFPGFFPDNQLSEWTWYRKDDLIVPDDYYNNSIYFIFEGIAGDALICVNGISQFTAGYKEIDAPLKYDPNVNNEYGKFIIYAGNLVNPKGKKNLIAIKIKNVSGLAGLYGKVYIACIK